MADPAAHPSKSDQAKHVYLSELFRKHASEHEGSKQLMTFRDFTSAVMPDSMHSLKEERIRWLWELADRDNSGSIDEEEFLIFENLISSPYADYEIAFRLFDTEAKGYITREQFKNRIDENSHSSAPPFNVNADWALRYFGATNRLDYLQFAQSLKTLGSERMRQAFAHFDRTGSGQIRGDDLKLILQYINDGRLTSAFKERVASLAGLTQPSARISYAEYVAFQYLLRDLSHHDAAIRRACEKHGGAVTADQYVREAKSSASFEITPLEIDVLFRAFGSKFDGQIHLTDYVTVIGTSLADSRRSYEKLNWEQARSVGEPAPEEIAIPKSAFQRIRESVENFALGAIAGAIGAFTVYPIDLVKTRMQNQRLAGEGALKLYNSSLDCFAKVLRQEGVTGLYRGLVPQLFGVAPEKAIKLTVNDLLRDLFADKKTRQIDFPLEVLSGGCAGASQVIFTNPIEIVKIRLQTAGENERLTGEARKGVMSIISGLGFRGLYKGAGACLLRDVPFSGIYFPAYAAAKRHFVKQAGGEVRPLDLLLAGALAGIPAAFLVTPADVVKTRLQVEARKGQATYTGISDCFWKILRTESPFALFKGSVARVFRSSPQFGVTLLCYELLHSWLAPHLPHKPLVNVSMTQEDLDSFRRQRVVDRLEAVETKWGFHYDDVNKGNAKAGKSSTTTPPTDQSKE